MARIFADLRRGLEVTLSNGRHTWRSDEPPESGGDDTGPSPYELLVGSLAACTLITLALYCRHKGVVLKSISATYEHGRIHAEDREVSVDPKKGFIDQITSHVRISGDFDDAQRKRLAQIVERCPVHKTLANGVKMIDKAEFG
ncbi:MAG: hypothetical protein GTN62_07205 [Gemmatimonadales bacterium]|nr:hypothetical protein [Gemmatimonadales bacterium]NIN11287.1 hypothetical protein [Gemmatimonadales bacterium]NIN49886.1 hypothetical protein [Gemmatimonadales bacterium]NIP07350.1 hypothetical protein [Gemmatimonadales bacterium]NIR03045.1 hypothetical protein [Gemmatimonadales bacterium]